MKLQLFKDNQEIAATDGLMHVDGRFNLYSICDAVRARNERFKKNFPHKIATGFAIYNKEGRNYGTQYIL